MTFTCAMLRTRSRCSIGIGRTSWMCTRADSLHDKGCSIIFCSANYGWRMDSAAAMCERLHLFHNAMRLDAYTRQSVCSIGTDRVLVFRPTRGTAVRERCIERRCSYAPSSITIATNTFALCTIDLKLALSPQEMAVHIRLQRALHASKCEDGSPTAINLSYVAH